MPIIKKCQIGLSANKLSQPLISCIIINEINDCLPVRGKKHIQEEETSGLIKQKVMSRSSSALLANQSFH